MSGNLSHFLIYILDLFILVIFMNNSLKKRRDNIPLVIFYIIFAVAEVGLLHLDYYQDNVFTYFSHIFTAIAKFIIVFLLTLTFSGTLSHKIFISVSLQLFKSVSNWAFSYVSYLVNPRMFEKNETTVITELGSRIVLLILVLVFEVIWNNHLEYDNPEYNFFHMFIPLITFILLVFLPFTPVSTTYNTVIMLILTVFNIGNYILIQNTFTATKMEYENTQMQQQIELQKEKYIQLSSSYKNTRSIVHDTKKHYMTIQEFISAGEYDKLSGYLYTACNELEATYTHYNTGNLVIDSMLTNYRRIAEQSGVSFDDEIHVNENKVPVEDYDLCIILGNLLDNCINAVINSTGYNRSIYIEIVTDENNKFIIHTKNTYMHTNRSTGTQTNTLEHGYGIRNIINIVKKYNGMHKFKQDEYFEVAIVIPIMN